MQKAFPAITALLVLMLLGGGYAFYDRTTSLTGALDTASSTIASLTTSLASSTDENARLSEALENERNRNDEFQDQVDELAGTVGRLDKLSKTDPELLQKYSKVYFLNENYFPSALADIPDEYRFQEEKLEQVHAGVWPHLQDLLEAAEDDDVELLIASSYRSFDRQAALKSSYVVRYGSGANAFSAEQGYSEHQLGTAVDITTRAVGGSFVGFDTTKAYEWLTDNAYKYGFILSYPKGNGYYVYEPWHWRYVGLSLAKDLHENEKEFYDLDQRELDPYLVDIFD